MLSVPIEKGRAFTDLPHAILASAVARGIKAKAPDVFYDDTVYIGQENHRDAVDLENTISHEIFFGMRRCTGWLAMIMTAILTSCWSASAAGRVSAVEKTEA